VADAGTHDDDTATSGIDRKRKQVAVAARR
jgi:hypothetical protein